MRGAVLALATALSIALPAWADGDPASASAFTDRVQQGKRQIALADEQSECVVVDTLHGKRLRTGLAAPCRFLRKQQGDKGVQSFSYGKVGRVFIFAGKPVDEIPAHLNWYKPADGCSDQARAVFLSARGELSLSRRCMRPKDKGLVCTALGLDEKDYWAYAFQDLPEMRCD